MLRVAYLQFYTDIMFDYIMILKLNASGELLMDHKGLL